MNNLLYEIATSSLATLYLRGGAQAGRGRLRRRRTDQVSCHFRSWGLCARWEYIGYRLHIQCQQRDHQTHQGIVDRGKRDQGSFSIYNIYIIYLYFRPLSTWPAARQCKQRSAPWLYWCAARYVRVARMSGTTTVCMYHRCHPLICRVVISSKSPTMCSLSSNPSPWRRKSNCNCPLCWPHIPSGIMPTMYRIHGLNRC